MTSIEVPAPGRHIRIRSAHGVSSGKVSSIHDGGCLTVFADGRRNHLMVFPSIAQIQWEYLDQQEDRK